MSCPHLAYSALIILRLKSSDQQWASPAHFLVRTFPVRISRGSFPESAFPGRISQMGRLSRRISLAVVPRVHFRRAVFPGCIFTGRFSRPHFPERVPLPNCPAPPHFLRPAPFAVLRYAFSRGAPPRTRYASSGVRIIPGVPLRSYRFSCAASAGCSKSNSCVLRLRNSARPR